MFSIYNLLLYFGNLYNYNMPLFYLNIIILTQKYNFYNIDFPQYGYNKAKRPSLQSPAFDMQTSYLFITTFLIVNCIVLPVGNSTVTVSPVLWPFKARPTGESSLILPLSGSYSVLPTML